MRRRLFSSQKKIKNINLCLSGGGALGFAHIGVIQALEEHGIFPNRISGTSMGAVVGCIYAAGYSPKYMLQLIKDDKLYKISHLLTLHSPFRKRGLSDHTTLQGLIRELIPHNSFEGLPKKLFVCVSDMHAAQYKIISEGGELDKWVGTSASIPGVFEPIVHNDILYVDGGVTNNLPAQCFESEFKRTIGVDVIPYTKLNAPGVMRPYDIALASIRAMQHMNSREGRDICTYLIEPLVLNKFHEFSFDNYQEIYQIGYDAAIAYIKANQDILELAKT
ncbi:patatin-like phospholipase family protein [Paludibacter sp. 221]|uniref:patatin-like phospholipase family protein n=1 Tax=Paludibacter sp. 221 TaxID=2302939 RepID=UPI0013D3F519|nr:patatin-like phospholipase family protein [Paludibacter sp. 221]NDV45450.1 patatin-like phospholipase family protein [Paludibacter sp. 221]